MMSDNKLSSRPPSMSGDRNALDDFIGGAGVHTPEPPAPAAPPAPPVATPEPYPWAAPGVRADVAKVFNLRLPEPDLLKLKYIAEHTPESMQQFCQRVLLPAIQAKIQELTER
ncbi:MAG: hypothetical protein KDJ31_16680 [Candidatus Competibacteraceae bacterium]|nr:hypothetical protein [Candidatus Competibacteraceae bacterium]MCB1821461.1 hypothetical protein [Candidatus Competibacteraceae bacterium]